MVAEFRAFLTKTNALALAIGVIIGAALGGVVKSLVDDVIMPPIGYLLGGVDFAQLKIVLGQKTAADGTVTEVAIRYGSFINAIITFIIVALVVFLIARTFIQGSRGGADEIVSVLQGNERRRRDEVQVLRERDLSRAEIVRPDQPHPQPGKLSAGDVELSAG